jgi:hypothetical protein
MKFMTTWKALPGARKEAVERFLAGHGVPPEGVTLLGRWHNTDCSGGYTLTESSNPQALFESAARWAICWSSTVTWSSKMEKPNRCW